MDKESLKEYLSSQYQGWNSFLNNVIFPIFGEDDFVNGYEAELLENMPERRNLATATGINSIKQIGSIYIGVEPLQIFDITVSDRVLLERNRVNIQRLIRSVMDHYSCAFMLFHYEDDTRWDWRFTFCHKSGTREDTTDSKRYTFLLGPGQSCRTAAENFMALYNKRNELGIKDIEDAFNVEALSDKFFKEYKTQYEAFVNFMVDPANGMRQDFIDTDFDHTGLTAEKIRDREEKPIRDYVKKLLGRIVFLHFLQKKGWLGVPADKEWGAGDHDFMLNLFKNATERQQENFLDDILENLFSEGLDCNRSDRGDIYDTKVEGFRNCRIPYLNGGLFERDNLDKKPSRFPASYFKDLLTMLSQYNFTIDENDPNDAEVGVDPEMLGRIFENLLEDNKDKGAFYTPKEIVQYMCRESLIAYLQTDITDDAQREAIRQFVTTHDVELLGDLKEVIDQKLIDVKICDPAIGSGAFPMGLLRELFFCRSAIEPNIVGNASKIKRHIIQNNIYGVDIERGAVEIARLRFWLSLIVDEETPEALPNLDFKIMQGNSLLESYDGMDLSNITQNIHRVIDIHPQRNLLGEIDGSQMEELSLFVEESDNLQEFKDNLRHYYEESDHQVRKELRDSISRFIHNLIASNIDLRIAQCERIISEIKESEGGACSQKSKSKLKTKQKECEDLKTSLSKIQNLNVQNDQFFLWHTWFNDVFSRPSKEGFDIVIGNPPWGADLSKGSKSILKIAYPEIDSSTPNSYAYFIGWGLRHFISSLMFVLPDSVLIKDFMKTRELLSSKVREVKWYQNCSVPKDKRLFKDVEHDICIVCLDNTSHSLVHFQTNNFENGNYVPKDNMVVKNEVLKKEFDFVFNLKASSTDWIIASKLLKHPPLDDIAQCHEGIHSGNVRDKLFIKVYKTNLKPMFYGGKAGDIIRPYVSYMCGWYVDYRASIINAEIGEYASLRDERLFILPKIYITRTGNPFKAFYDESSYASNNFFSLQIKDYKNNTKDNLLFLLPFINSKVCQFFIRKFAAPRLGDSFIETKIIHLLKFPIPPATPIQRRSIIILVGKILAAKKQDPQADTSVLEQEIDKMVYALYGLTEEEICVIEQSK